jgi:hypothetical protein
MEAKTRRQKGFFPQLQQHESKPKTLPTASAQVCRFNLENSPQLS